MTQEHQHPDYKYVLALIQNEHEMIQEIYRLFFPKIKRLITRNSGSHEDAKDIFQEALLAVYDQAKRSDFRISCPFDAYLYSVCRNLWLSQLRKRKKQGVTVKDTEQSVETKDALILAEETTTNQSKRKLFIEMFDKLGESCQAILSRNWKGLSIKLISEELGISYGYARKKKSECVARLTQLVQKHPEYHRLRLT